MFLLAYRSFIDVFRLQSYGFFSIGVSPAYGKDTHKQKFQVPKNQAIIENEMLQPMEK
jgi:hypothetical protein